MMNSSDTSAAPSTMIEPPHMRSTPTTVGAMAAEWENQRLNTLRELELALLQQPSSAGILGQDVVTGPPKKSEASKPESNTGIELLLKGLAWLESSGSLRGALVTIKFNDSGSDIQGITLSSQSSTETKSPDTNGEQTPSTPILTLFDIETPEDKPRWSTGPRPDQGL